MPLKCGIIGLPNIGKSTLFNALTKSSTAETANYPFCTIDPNFGVVKLPDPKLLTLANLVYAEKITPTTIEFVDIAGLVKGASKGEGLGNKFLSHIKSVDAIIHVVKCFKNSENEYLNPTNDIEIIETELLLADLNFVEQLLKKSTTKTSDEIIKLKQMHKHLSKGLSLRELNNIPKSIKKEFLTNKKVIFVLNTSENHLNDLNKETKQVLSILQKKEDTQNIILSAQIESELSEINDIEEKQQLMQELGIKGNILENLVKSVYKILELKSFYTVGKKETKAWSFKNGTIAQKAASLIHSDIEKNFIKVEVIKYPDFIQYKNESILREKGKIKIEGKFYEIQNEDILHFKFHN